MILDPLIYHPGHTTAALLTVTALGFAARWVLRGAS